MNQASSRPCKLQLSNVCRTFRNSGVVIPALEGISLSVCEGEFLCVLGPSGCGKSTLLSLMAGLDEPTSGEIWLDGNRITEPGIDRIVIFQELGLFPWLTVRENVEFGLKMQGLGSDQRRKRAREFLQMVHLSQFENSYIHELSGGMKQRVALARSLVTSPDVLLMDEPFAALDAQTRDLLHEELARIWSETGKTIVFVTHNVREAVRLGDRVVLMTFRPGRVKSEFTISLPRPRNLEDPELTLMARAVLSQLKEEIDKAVEAEFGYEKDR